MAEPPNNRRSRRPDSKQMWDESDRRDLPSREREAGREDRDRRNRDWDRRYRSRSPRGERDRGGDHGGRRNDRDRRDNRDRDGGRGARDNTRREDWDSWDHRERDVGRDARDKPRVRSRDRDRAREAGQRKSRSRSPRKGRDVKEIAKPIKSDERLQERIATPPVSFKVGGHDHDVMEVDGGADEPGNSGPKSMRGKKAAKKAAVDEEDDDGLVVENGSMAAMQAMMGFRGFGTTQNKKVAGNDVSAVRKEKKTEYRQYMNRVGGFNRPLSPSHD